jgi:hypothetical protein
MAVSGMFVFMVTASLCGRPAPLPRRTLNADTTLPVRGNQDRTEMELSCPHDRPRAGIAAQPEVGSKRAAGRKVGPRQQGSANQVILSASTPSQRQSSTGQRRRFHGRKNLAPAERSGLFLGRVYFTGMPMWRRSVAGSLPRRGVGCCVPLLTHLPSLCIYNVSLGQSGFLAPAPPS